MSQIFEQLSNEFAAGGIGAALSIAEKELRDGKRYHELFEVLKMQSREQLGLPLLHQEGQQTSEEHQRALEDGLISACRDVGFALLDDGQIQDSWVYLRHLNDNDAVLEKVHKLDVNDENLEQIVGLLLYEGLDSAAGYKLVLENYGTCNAITTMQQTMYGRPKEQRQAAGRLLVAHLHNELLENVKAHVEREEGKTPDDERLVPIMENRDFLFADGAYHIDTSHLSSTMQIASELSDNASLELALDLARYGEHLRRRSSIRGRPAIRGSLSHDSKILVGTIG